jgi:hypothetical protein
MENPANLYRRDGRVAKLFVRPYGAVLHLIRGGGRRGGRLVGGTVDD